MRSLFRALTAGALAFSLVLTSAAAALSPIRSFESAGFVDVPDNWSYPYILSCYELGLMSGQGSGLFAPGSTVSVAEGVTVAARVHNLWYGGNGLLSESTPWYNSAIEYGVANGLLTQGQFSDYSAPATRAQLAGLLAKALPEWDYAPINEISSLPDVTKETPCAADILKLYNAGILTGGDVYGTFFPDSPITRAELAAILCRLVRPETRQTFSPKVAEPEPESLSILYFYATWCEPCRKLSPVINQLADEYQPKGILFQKIDVDDQFSLAELYQVDSFPTVIFLKDGQEVDRRIGGLPYEDYCSLIAQWL